MKTENEHNCKNKNLPYLLIAGAFINFTFWCLYYTGVIELTDINDGFVSSFETAFPVADFIMSVFLVLSAVCMLKRKRAGVFFMTISGAMLIYLATLDITFYLSNGYYSTISSAIIVSVCINVACLSGGAYALIKSWNIWKPAK